MNKEEITKKYNELVSNIEQLGIYDGRGTVDEYVCEKCKTKYYTTYKDKGVTPFVIQCREGKCKEYMQHERTFKKSDIPSWITVHNWVRPTLEQVLKMSPGEQEHALQGGLFLEDELK